MMRRRYEFVYEMSKKWQAWGIDALVTPVFPHTAFKAANADEMGLMLEYNFIWSLIHFPSGVIPIT
jgi:Asp-tRNA(Asn)/Glu-tRNA(Gln) amidotransferase A subunit family amidase